MPSEYYKLFQKEFVLSVHAVWPDAAKNATLKAAKMASIFPVTPVKEPRHCILRIPWISLLREETRSSSVMRVAGQSI